MSTSEKLENKYCNCIVKLLQNLSDDERAHQQIMKELRRLKKGRKADLKRCHAMETKAFESILACDALRPHDDTVITFERAQSLPEYQAELDAVRSNRFLSASSAISDDAERHLKILAFINFRMARRVDWSSEHPDPESVKPSKRMRM